MALDPFKYWRFVEEERPRVEGTEVGQDANPQKRGQSSSLEHHRMLLNRSHFKFITRYHKNHEQEISIHWNYKEALKTSIRCQLMESKGFLVSKRIFSYFISHLSKIATSAPEQVTVEHVMFLSEASKIPKRGKIHIRILFCEKRCPFGLQVTQDFSSDKSA